MPCCDDVEETDGRLEPRMLFKLVLSRYGTLLLVIGNPPPCEHAPNGSCLRIPRNHRDPLSLSPGSSENALETDRRVDACDKIKERKRKDLFGRGEIEERTNLFTSCFYN